MTLIHDFFQNAIYRSVRVFAPSCTSSCGLPIRFHTMLFVHVTTFWLSSSFLSCIRQFFLLAKGESNRIQHLLLIVRFVNNSESAIFRRLDHSKLCVERQERTTDDQQSLGQLRIPAMGPFVRHKAKDKPPKTTLNEKQT